MDISAAYPPLQLLIGARGPRRAALVRQGVEGGMVGVNTFAVSWPETPFGGIKESGYGSEGGREGVDAYLATKFISEAAA